VARVAPPKSNLIPCGDGKHAWVWTAKAVWRIDDAGKTVGREASLSADGDEVRDLFPAGTDSAGARVAWIKTQRGCVYALGETGWHPPYRELPNASYREFWPTAIGSRAIWVETTTGVVRLDVDGNCQTYPALAGLTVTTIQATADREGRAWAIAGRPGGPSDLWLLRENGNADHLTEGTAILPENVYPPLLRDSSPPSALWVELEKGTRLLREGADGERSNWNAPNGETFGTIKAVGQVAWVLEAKGQKLYRFHSGTDGSDFGQLVLELEPGDWMIEEVYPARESSDDAWVVAALKVNQNKKLYKLYAVHLQEKAKELLVNEVTWVVPAPDGRGVWAGTSGGQVYRVKPSAAPQVLKESEALAVSASQGVLTAALPAKDVLWAARNGGGVYRFEDNGTVGIYLEQQEVVGLAGLSSDGRFVWAVPVEGFGLWPVKVADNGASELMKDRFVQVNSTAVNVFPARRPNRGWIASPGGVYAYGPASDVPPFSLSVGGADLPSGDGHRVLRLTPGPRKAVLKDFNPGKAHDKITGQGTARVWLYGSHGNLIAESQHGCEPGKPITLPFDSDWPPLPDERYEVRLSYTEDAGTQLQAAWHDLTFEEELTPWWRKLLATVGVVVLLGTALVLLPRLFRGPPLLNSLIRYPTWGLAVLAPFHAELKTLFEQTLYPEGVALGLVILLAALVGVGLLSPKALRAFAGDDAAANKIALFAVQFPRFRARLFHEYVSELEKRLQAEVSEAKEEYVALPALLHPDDQPSPRIRPDEAVRDLLTARRPEDRKNVLVEWPGGRGKSAFVRQVLKLALARFRSDPSAPLPVFCEPAKDKTVATLVHEGLGRHALSDTVFAEHLFAGHFVAVFDRLSESEMPPEQLADFVKSEAGQKTCLLLATRPGRPYREALRKVASDRIVLVDPQSLDENTLAKFVEVYLARDRQDLKTRDRAAPLSEKTRVACRAMDGTTYLPLLVRLAILVGAEADSVAKIYRMTFNRLVRDRYPDLFDKTAQMCVSTYGKQGNQARVLATEVEKEPRALLQQLYDVGILVSAPAAGPREGAQEHESLPTQVRFFHDSMQSYLTAVGLLHSADGWSELEDAACNPHFGRPSELFQMCLHVFKPDERLNQELKKCLRDWANRFERGLSKEVVLRACPDDLREALGLQLHPEESAGIALKKAVDMCGEQAGDVTEEVRLLGIVYGNLGPTIWDLKHPDGVAAASSQAVPARSNAPPAIATGP
jgi:hypothetical protein